MKIGKDKTATAIALFLMFAIAVSLVVLPVAKAHDPPWLDRPTYCYVAATPNAGVGQEVLIVFWLNFMPPTSSGAYGDRWIFYLDITKPDNSKETIGPITSDPVGGGWYSYTPNQEGTYTVVARFPGQKITGVPGQETNINVNDTFAASTSKPASFNVQAEPIPRYVETPLPSGYWTRPVSDANRGWGSAVMGQWTGTSYCNALKERGIPYTTAPESSHILWTRSVWSGGTMGGQHEDVGYYTGIAYEQYSGPQIVLEGRAYYSVQQPPRYGWYCIDLYTGETIYYENNTDGTAAMPAFGQVLNIMNPNQFGGFPYLWRTSGVGTPVITMGPFGPTTVWNTWEMLDGFTGNAICQIANVSTSGTQFEDEIGSICYVNFVNLGTSSNPNYYMQVWNTTEAIWWRPQFGVYPPKTLLDGSTSIAPTSTSNSYWTWRPATQAVYDGNNGYSMNVSVASILGPRNAVVNQTGAIKMVYPGDSVVVGTSGQNDARGVVQGFLKAYSLKAPNYGNVLWETSFTPPKASIDFPNSTTSGGINQGASFPLAWSGVSVPDGVFAFVEPTTGKVWVYSLDSGQELWTTEVTEQFYYYEHFVAINEGKVYTHGLSGVLAAYNATTGEFLWNWTAPLVGHLESAYPYTPLRLAFFADGKAYFHSLEGAGLNSPIRRDGALWCIDTETGEMLWKLTCWPGYSGNTPVIADGRILVLDNHDNQIYCIGKGPSATTVAASPEVSVHGSSVMIKGAVTDQTAGGRSNVAGSLDFALKGTPAISDEDMDAWMEYLFHQRPIPADAKGVEVVLTVLDPNDNVYEIGRTTSDIKGNYGFAFDPLVPGMYQVTATFEGSSSYGPSSATTYLTVDEAPAATAEPTPPPASVADMYFVPAIAGVIVAIIAVGLLLFLLLRKR
ncbi:PQQ-like beta-propeller repeat protein [Candidatus Bathyarchaeota archaeon]|nr:PQQ-like beta-propeller repeat protein [Candidatus Bathyarchaeota archaeon]